MADWQFRAASEAAFATDLNGLCSAFGYAPLSADGQTLASCTFQDLMRFDFDTMTLPSGWHVNARATLLPKVDQTAAAAALARLGQQIAGYFSTLPTMTNAAPAAYPSGGGQTWHRTAAGTILISPAPTSARRIWA